MATSKSGRGKKGGAGKSTKAGKSRRPGRSGKARASASPTFSAAEKREVRAFLESPLGVKLAKVIDDDLFERYGVRATLDEKGATHVAPCHTDAGDWCWASIPYNTCNTTEDTCVRERLIHNTAPI